MGSLSTALAAHFAHWVRWPSALLGLRRVQVEKTEDIKQIFDRPFRPQREPFRGRFARLYNDPEEVLRP